MSEDSWLRLFGEILDPHLYQGVTTLTQPKTSSFLESEVCRLIIVPDASSRSQRETSIKIHYYILRLRENTF